MPSTLTKAETEDFAAARAPPQAPQVVDKAPSTPRNGSKRDKLRRFTFKRLSRKHEAIAENENEDTVAPASPASSDSTSSLSTDTSGSKRPVGPQDFDLLCVIGQGAFGKVIQVRHQPTDEILAMKIVSNKYIVQHNSVSYLQAERDIMTKINHPFLISLRYAFQTKSNVYLVMPFVAGGELFHHLHKEGLLLESSAKFYAAEMVLALEHLHSKGVIHRDLKPENVLLGADGHIRLTDFGLAKEMADEDDSTSTMCGTNEYMPPEMIRRKAYNQAVDWWALGALIYEMVTGYPPFRHKNRKKLHHKILNEKLPLPKWLGSDTHSILKQLLERNVDKRLGSGKSTMFQVKGVQAIKKHAFFKGIDWGLLEEKKVQPPILPNVLSNTDTTYFSEEFTTQDVGRRSRIDSSGASGDSKKLFARFSWVADDAPSFADIVRAGGAKEEPVETVADGVAKVAIAEDPNAP
ncbi:AGC protein kinase [Phytophthora nicotianae CJ01A1]|uniref:AGC protein kinase n=3 Tax=Phytophthora nicotianae TaxID=4792 RepID=W2NTJ5_PHYNI|nr:AGC protein kinase [Phytophthora nicotianae]ETM52012.1 AGC protein kinase [Phytophthora nicotianae]ETO81172.1 AGC protein kinase [Phytophthora nicotianae P1976]ETP22229.1 AGC protein kinase [Phytophthora nicotianae CJ01A1]